MKMRKIFKILPFLIVFYSVKIYAQDVDIIEKKCQLEITINKGKLAIVEKNYQSKLFINNFNNKTSETIYYWSFDSIQSMNAYSKIPLKDGKYKTIPVKTIEKNIDVYQQNIFYHDSKKNQFSYPSIVSNSIGAFEYNRIIKDPHFINSFYFNDDMNVGYSSYSISAPVEVKIGFSLFNVENCDIKFKTDTTKGIIHYSWEVRNLKKVQNELKSPSASYFSPHIIARIKSYKIENSEIKVLEKVDDLFSWYNTLLNKMPIYENDAELKSKVQELTQNCKTDFEKTNAIFAWVRSNIKYVAFEDGLGGFVPRNAGSVFTKKYGDCKDMANLLKSLLLLANIPAYNTWVGTTKLPYTYEETPTAHVDNHMICASKLNDSIFFLDPTNDYSELENYPRAVQGKEALVRFNDSEYKVIKIPTTDYKKNTRTDSLNLQIVENFLLGKVKTNLTGYKKEDFLYKELSLKYKNSTQLLQEFLQIAENNTHYTDSSIVKNKTIGIKSNVQIKNKIFNSDSKMYINLNLNPDINEIKPKDLKERNNPILEDYKEKYTMICKLEIPKGYEITYIPENTNYENTFFKIVGTYSKSQNYLIYTKELISNYMLLEKENFADLKTFLDKNANLNEQKIILQKTL